MYTYLLRRMIRRALRHHQAGNVDALLKFYSEDVTFVFPGRNSWAGQFRGKEAVGTWLRRFHRAGLKIEPHEIAASGFPWNMTVCIRITDQATDSRGHVFYENRAVLFGKVRWGKIVFYEVYEDTEKVKAFDEYLGSERASSGAGPS
ncbi:MAG TPA: nuclear transport factor 2 family protein [Candidatus Acidoferrales bacterium]|nr:nuclear transport factor 2 family protein [Candidatus Acidoferrales bacterium]